MKIDQLELDESDLPTLRKLLGRWEFMVETRNMPPRLGFVTQLTARMFVAYYQHTIQQVQKESE